MGIPEPMIAAAARGIAAWAATQPVVLRAFIFGSRARGDHRPDSDIDIALELDDSPAGGGEGTNSVTLWHFDSAIWLEELQARLPFPVDLQHLLDDKSSPIICAAVARSSLLVYEKQAAPWSAD